MPDLSIGSTVSLKGPRKFLPRRVYQQPEITPGDLGAWLGEAIREKMEREVEIEESMGVPFPTTDIILLFASGMDTVFDSDCWGLHRNTHIVV